MGFSPRKRYPTLLVPHRLLASHQKGNGSVWESNPLTAFFKPPTGFEDQGPHQRCKHSRKLGMKLPIRVLNLKLRLRVSSRLHFVFFPWMFSLGAIPASVKQGNGSGMAQ